MSPVQIRFVPSEIPVRLSLCRARRAQARRDVRPWAAAGFGLLHGFGFASVLREMALPGSGAAQAWALAGFNVGVEIGQLFVVVIVAVPLALLRRHSP